LPVDNPDVDGAPLRVRMTDEFRAFFRAGPPPGYVRAQVAEQLLSLSRQSIWLHIKSGRLEACHVARGKQRGIYVRIPDMPPLLPEASHDAHS